MIPTWLLAKLTEFDWSEGQKTTIDDFLSAYTLHDSVWIGIWHEARYEQAVTAIVNWDTSFCSDRVPYPGPSVDEWPLLLIHFPAAYLLSIEKAKDIFAIDTISIVKSKPVSQDEWVGWLDVYAIFLGMQSLYDDLAQNKPINHTVVYSVYDGEKHIIHRNDIILQCADIEGNTIKIPGI